ncbi:N-6 DNA methylase [Bacteroides faecalis]|uniref:site-specific DNA-methyltransferase (adenine-specific) n=1 Tax=Bacteroides faecalis TaxID=2447885 RepID=A0A401LQ25_9BACE|nr:N-6 DNA methylase [Bacteroides faecalis]GCB33537.1 hypothetical protein KGMB02408_04820 [Bacteroides faecalis]
MLEVAYERHGKVGVVTLHDVLFRGVSERKLRQKTIEENYLEAVIGLPTNLFSSTGIPATIMIFNKKTDNVLFIDASHEYENGKNQNRLRNHDIDHIVSTYHKFTAEKLSSGVTEDKYAYVAMREEIVENDYNFNISRYVGTHEKEEEEIDIMAVQKEIDSLETKLTEGSTNKDESYLKELGY